jgi:hypothetical protein
LISERRKSARGAWRGQRRRALDGLAPPGRSAKGREALCQCKWGGEAGAVKALLETNEIILSGELKRRAPLSAVAVVRADGDVLRLQIDGEAALWARKLTTPPPTLAEKLGLAGVAAALVIGKASGVLAEALTGATTEPPDRARMLLAVASDAAELQTAVAAHGGLKAGAPMWIVHGNGKGCAFNDNTVRAALRAQGFIDTTICAVSAELSATRYSRRP